MSKQLILKFLKEEIKQNAPLQFDNEQLKKQIRDTFEIKDLNLKYPYKPFLILSIIDNCHPNEIFNNWIDLKNINIVKSFYDYICNDSSLYEILRSHKGKSEWSIGFNINASQDDIIYKSVIQVFIDSPLRAFKKHQWISVDKTNIKINIDSHDIFNDINLLKEGCWEIVYKCVPWYQKFYELRNFSFSSIDIAKQITSKTNKIYEVVSREYQHLFRKEILDRDCRCIICCTDNKDVLQACHIKPFADCNDNEKYDCNNGITLCSNHHALFDRNKFTFNDDWKVIIFKSLKESDIHLFFRQYESCYSNILKNELSSVYLKYRNDNLEQLKKSLN